MDVQEIADMEDMDEADVQAVIDTLPVPELT